MPPASTLPPEYQAQLNQVALQKALSQAIMQRGLQQPRGQMAGRFFVPPSLFENLGQLAQTAAGAYGQYQAGQKEVGLAKDFQLQQQQAVQEMIDAMTGKSIQAQTGADLNTQEYEEVKSGLTKQSAANFQSPSQDTGAAFSSAMQDPQRQALMGIVADQNRDWEAAHPGLQFNQAGPSYDPRPGAQPPSPAADPLAALQEMPDAGAGGPGAQPPLWKQGLGEVPTGVNPMAPPSGMPPTAGLTPGVSPQTGPLPENWQTPPSPVGITREVPYPPDLSAPLPPGVAAQVHRQPTRESMMPALIKALGNQNLPAGAQAAAGSMLGSLMKDRDTGQTIQTPWGDIAKEATPGDVLRNETSKQVALSGQAIRQQQNEMMNELRLAQYRQMVQMDNHKIEQDKREFDRQVHTDEEKAEFKRMQLQERQENNLRHAQEFALHHRETEAQALQNLELKKQIAEMGQRKLKPGEEWTDETKTDVRAIKGSDLYKKQKAEFTKGWSEAKTAVTTSQDVADKVAWLLDPKQKAGLEASFGRFGSGYITSNLPYAKEYQQKLGDLENAMKKFGLDLANASGRSIGSIQVAEWDILKGMVASLAPGLNEDTARKTMEYIRGRVEGLARQTQEKFKVEFGNSQFMNELGEQKAVAPSAPAPSSTPQIPPGWTPKFRATDGTGRTVYEGPNGELRTFD